ncbi:hypothetical protein NCS55_01500100 [Fusarium keratoplasticum]|nr:hypothetical protein NCS55_01500100 [Fusarium keratoplasticum]
MSTFMPQPAYSHVAAPSLPRQFSRARSAFSAFAKPDEDWIKISDLAECRRIQNRIAQRSYRKKLKQRRVDLEQNSKRSSKSGTPQPSTAAKPVVSQGQFIPSMEPTDGFFPGIYGPRARSDSPPQFTYSTYSTSDEVFLAPFGSAQSYSIMATAGAYHSCPLTSTVPMMLTSAMHASAATKWEPSSDDELATDMIYGYMPPMDFNMLSPCDQPKPHISNSSDYLANYSKAGYEYPTMSVSKPN